MTQANVIPAERQLKEAVDGVYGHTSHIVTIDFPPARGWKEAVNLGAPDTLLGVVDSMSVPRPLTPAEGRLPLTLVNFKRSVLNDQYALDWARKEKKKEPASPWLLLAIGEQHPNLPQVLRQPFLYLSSLTICDFYGERRTMYLAYRAGRRQVLMAHPDAQCNEETWFVFVGR